MDTPAQPVIDDVWSRTEPKYRTRAIILLIANMVLFGGLCCFMYWLRYGWYFPLTHEHYTTLFSSTLNFSSPTQITLHDLFMNPINLQWVPMHGVVIGLLIASLVSIPILVSILYRFRASIPFCLMVGFLAVMPWLGATLLLSCAIAAYGRIKLKFRFAAAVLGLVPIGVYLFTASRGYAAPQDVLTPQIERGLVVAPLLLSALASCALMVIVLTIAHVVDYRPGPIAPLLAVMFLTPWFLFMKNVGRDELHYRLFEQNYGPQSREYFASADANFAIRQVAVRLWAQHDQPRPTIDVFEERVRRFFETQLHALQIKEPADRLEVAEFVDEKSLDHLKLFARGQHHVAGKSDTFLRDFPNSRYVPCVLYIKGRALDMRMDIDGFRRSGVLRSYDDFPNEASRTVWTALVKSDSDSPLANVARYRLAQLDARRGDIDAAIAGLIDLIAFDERLQHSQAGRNTLHELLAKKPAEASLESEYTDFRDRAAGLLTLLRYNRDPTTGDAPLIAYLNCDPRHDRYLRNLRDILQRFDTCKIRDNIKLELILAEQTGAARIEKLLALQDRLRDSDVLPRVLFELGAVMASEGRGTDAEGYFDELTARFPDSTFASDARHITLVGRLSNRGQTGG